MTNPHKPEPPRMIPAGGLSHREERTRMECLRLAADAGGTPSQIISRAVAMVRYIEAADNELARNSRWTCLRMASQMEGPVGMDDDIIRIATAFEDFVSGTRRRIPA